MFPEFLTTERLLLIATVLAILIVTLLADRLIRRAISRYSKRLKLEPHVENIFKLTARALYGTSDSVCMHASDFYRFV